MEYSIDLVYWTNQLSGPDTELKVEVKPNSIALMLLKEAASELGCTSQFHKRSTKILGCKMHRRLWNMVHAPILPCLTQATLIEIGLLIWVEDEIILASSKWTNLVGNKVSAVANTTNLITWILAQFCCVCCYKLKNINKYSWSTSPDGQAMKLFSSELTPSL